MFSLAVTTIFSLKPTKSALGFFEVAQKGNGDWWGVPEAPAAIDYWRGVALSKIDAPPDSVIDCFEKYLAACPDGMLAEDAMVRLKFAKAQLGD